MFDISTRWAKRRRRRLVYQVKMQRPEYGDYNYHGIHHRRRLRSLAHRVADVETFDPQLREVVHF